MKHSTCFGQTFRPSSAVQDNTYSNRHMSDTADCLLASRQQYLFDICLFARKSNQHKNFKKNAQITK